MDLRIFTEIDVNLVTCLAAAWLIELALGAPRFLPKPSWLVRRFARFSAGRFLAIGDRAGFFLTLYYVMLAFILPAVLLNAVPDRRGFYYYPLCTLLCCWAFDTRAAADGALAANKTLKPREHDRIRGVLADVAASCVRGAVGPLFVMLIGTALGIPAPLAVVYKALSILDDEVQSGGRSQPCGGRAVSALLGIINYIPARVCGLLLPLCAPVRGGGFSELRRGYKVLIRDHRNDAALPARAAAKWQCQAAAWPGSAIAGVLGIRLDTNIDASPGAAAPLSGDSHMGIGDDLRDPEPADISRAVKMMAALSAGTVLMGCGALLLLKFM